MGLQRAGGLCAKPPFDPLHFQRAGGTAFLSVDKPRASKKLRGFELRVATVSLFQAPRPQSQTSAPQYAPQPCPLIVPPLTEMQDLGDTGLKEAESGPAVFSENLNLEACGEFRRREGRLVILRLRGQEVSAE